MCKASAVSDAIEPSSNKVSSVGTMNNNELKGGKKWNKYYNQKKINRCQQWDLPCLQARTKP